MKFRSVDISDHEKDKPFRVDDRINYEYRLVSEDNNYMIRCFFDVNRSYQFRFAMQYLPPGNFILKQPTFDSYISLKMDYSKPDCHIEFQMVDRINEYLSHHLNIEIVNEFTKPKE